MQGPLIFIATNRLKPGRLDSERARVPGLVEFVEANELTLDRVQRVRERSGR